MGAEQAVVALAGAVCIAGSVGATTHRDARTAGVSLLLTLLALAVLEASLGAPVVAGAVLAVALFVVVPVAVHVGVPAARAVRPDPAGVLAAAAIVCLPLLILLLAAIAGGELPQNVSVRTTDGYDLAAIGGLLAGPMAGPALAAAAVLVTAVAVASRRVGGP